MNNFSENVIDLTVPQTPIYWAPLLIVGAGFAHYYWYTYVSPYPQKLLDEIDQRSVFGMGSLNYQPEIGVVAMFMGGLLFLVVNYLWFAGLFS